MSEFHFVRPVLLWLLLLLPLLFFLLWRTSVQRGAWTKLIDPALQPFVLTQHTENSKRSFSWLWYWLAALLIIALAGPAWERLPQPVYTKQLPLVLALDLSQSMNAQDVLPSRLDLAKIKIQDILTQRPDGQAALLVFAGEAFVVTPMTDDAKTIISLLPSLRAGIMPVQGSRIAPALALAGQLLQNSNSQNGQVILLTDGVSDQDQATDQARSLAAKGHRVSLISFGTEQGDIVRDDSKEFVKDRNGTIVVARVPFASLQAIALSGRGEFFESSISDAALDSLLQTGVQGFGEAWNKNELAADVWREQGPFLLLLCLPFVALLFRRGLLLVIGLTIILPLTFSIGPVAHATFWDDLWSRKDQQAQKLYQNEQFAGAAELYRDPERRATALFRDQQYEQSASDLGGVDTSDAHYNRGNALAHAGNIGAAISAYEKSLSLDANNADAKHNLEVLKKMQQQQQEQSESDENQEQQSNNEQKQDQEQNSDEKSQEQQQSDSSEQQGEEPSEEEKQAQEQEQQEQEQEQSEAQQQMAESTEQMTEEEKQQAVEQWLRRIPDDPGGLLRRKFLRQYRQRDDQSRSTGENW